MPDPSRLPVFVLAALALLLVPGPSVLYIVTRSVSQGRTAGLVSALGIQCGGLVHVAAAALGLSAILVSSALAFNVVRFAGAAYLVFLGVRQWLERGDGKALEVRAEPLRRVFAQGLMVNALNPKTALFFFAFLPQFVDPARGAVTGQFLFLGLLFIALAMCTDSAYALLSSGFSGALRARGGLGRRSRLVTGGVYVGLGVTAALTGSSHA